MDARPSRLAEQCLGNARTSCFAALTVANDSWTGAVPGGPAIFTSTIIEALEHAVHTCVGLWGRRIGHSAAAIARVGEHATNHDASPPERIGLDLAAQGSDLLVRRM